MENIITDILHLFLTKAVEKEYNYFYILTLAIISILLFKQFKSNIMESYNYEDTQIKESINFYLNGILAIKKYKLKTIDFEMLNIELFKLLPWAPNDLRDLVFNLDKDESDLDNIKEMIRSNLISTQYLRKQDISKAISAKPSEKIWYMISKSKMYYVVVPLIFTLLVVMALITSFLLTLNFQNYTIYQKILMVSYIAFCFIYVEIVLTIIDLISENRFEISSMTIISSLILLASPFIAFIHFYNIGIVIFEVYILFYLFYMFKKIIKPDLKRGLKL